MASIASICREAGARVAVTALSCDESAVPTGRPACARGGSDRVGRRTRRGTWTRDSLRGVEERPVRAGETSGVSGRGRPAGGTPPVYTD